MKFIGLLFLVVGGFIGFGARKIVIGKYKPNLKNEQDLEEFEQLIGQGTIFVKLVGLALVVLGFLFVVVLP